MKYYSEVEKEQIQSALEGLFVSQGKRPNEKEITVMGNQILGRGYPTQAIIAGLKSLNEAEMHMIKLGYLLEAIRGKVINEPNYQKEDCKYCGNSGYVPMEDEKKRTSAMACKCNQGKEFARSTGNVMWEGLNTQQSLGRVLNLHWSVTDKLKGD